MRLTTRILQITSVMFIVTSLLCPVQAQAQSQKISPGTYMGRFRYSAYSMMIDDQSSDDWITHVDMVFNTYVEGTLTIQVDKSGKILPGIKFVPDSIPTYYIYTFRVIPSSCNVTGYLEGETKLDLKQNSSDTFDSNAPAFSATAKFSNISPLNYYRMGICAEGPHMASRPLMMDDVNYQIGALNKAKLMKFSVVRISKDQFSGTIILEGYDTKVSTPGGYIMYKDKGGFFNVHINDVLAPLTEEDVVSLVEEWRSK